MLAYKQVGGRVEKYLRPLLLILFLFSIALFYRQGGGEYLNLKSIQSQLHYIQRLYTNDPLKIVLSIFFGIVLLASLSIPGSIVLTLLSGAILHPLMGTILVCTATTSGAVIAFLFARFVFKDFVKRKFHRQYHSFNRKMKEEGNNYLFTLRIIPASPYVVINLVMGITPMRVTTFAFITFVGMFPGTFIYVYAGRKFAELESVRGILSPPIIISLVSLSFLPYAWRYILGIRKRAWPINKEAIMQNDHHHRNSLYSISGVEFEGEDMARMKEHHGPLDEKIKEEASHRLKTHLELKAHDIDVEVEDGTVFLKGAVSDPVLKRMAHECVEGIKGVTEIVNQLSLANR